MLTPDRRKSKLILQSTNADQKLLETVFFIAICRQWLAFNIQQKMKGEIMLWALRQIWSIFDLDLGH